MKFCDLKKIKQAPAEGRLLAYTRKKVIYGPYKSLQEVEGTLSKEELLELHLFDRDKEYRSIATRSPRYKDGIIEAIVDFPENDWKNIYKEKVLLEPKVGGGAITILNHLRYEEENGTLVIDNYRLRGGDM